MSPFDLWQSSFAPQSLTRKIIRWCSLSKVLPFAAAFAYDLLEIGTCKTYVACAESGILQWTDTDFERQCITPGRHDQLNASVEFTEGKLPPTFVIVAKALVKSGGWKYFVLVKVWPSKWPTAQRFKNSRERMLGETPNFLPGNLLQKSKPLS